MTLPRFSVVTVSAINKIPVTEDLQFVFTTLGSFS